MNRYRSDSVEKKTNCKKHSVLETYFNFTEFEQLYNYCVSVFKLNMNKLSFFCLIILIITTTGIYAYKSSKIIPIKYQTRRGISSKNIYNPSKISCKTGEILISCGIDGHGLYEIQGTYIDPNDSNTCIAGTSNSNYAVTAVAICGKFPDGSINTVNTITNELQLNNQIITQCPSGSILTGCQVNYQSGTINNIRGSYSGKQKNTNTSPTQIGTKGINTKNQCIAEAQSNSTKIRGGAQCLQTTSNYELGTIISCIYWFGNHTFK